MNAMNKTTKRETEIMSTSRIVAGIMARRSGYVPDWLPKEGAPDSALIQIVSRYIESIYQRLGQAPGKNLLAFLDLLGLQLIPPQSARAPMVFTLAENAADARLPAGSRVAAPPPPGSTEQVVFETEETVGLSSGKLKKAVSLWPGRDQYLDHTGRLLAGQAFKLFERRELADTPHVLYMAHDRLLALAGRSTLDVNFELSVAGSEHLSIMWEYWDGAVWREFLYMRPACNSWRTEALDSTDGLQRSGRQRLLTDCAATSKTKVNGVEAFWVRGRLTEPLPPSSSQVLPQVDAIKLGTEILRPLKPSMEGQSSLTGRTGELVYVTVHDDTGIPLKGVRVNNGDVQTRTDLNGECTLLRKDDITAVVVGAGSTVKTPEEDKEYTAKFLFTTEGLLPDQAFVDAADIDLTRPFYPFGLQPLPGSAFYFTSEEAFTKPGARLQLYVQTAQTPADQLDIDLESGNNEPLRHNVSWEYWNGSAWISLKSWANDPDSSSDVSANDFTGTDVINDLVVPRDMTPTKVNDKEAFWIRVRLLSGTYGFKSQIDTGDGQLFPFVIAQPPLLSKFLLGYTWQDGPYEPEHVLTYNDFQYADHTEENKWPGSIYPPYQPVNDATPALYLGFDKRPPVDRCGIFFDIAEQPNETAGGAFEWQYWDGLAWRTVDVDDETRSLSLPGIVSFIGPEDSQALARFDEPLYWLRARTKEDGPPGEPSISNIAPNAVWAVQRQTTVDEPVGTSNGQPSQVFSFRQAPILAGERIEIRELAGARANVEWRYIARELFGEGKDALSELEDLLGRESSLDEIAKGDLRLVRDRRKRVAEVWVRWFGQRNLFFSRPDDRHYVVERARGRLMFGDNQRGKVPPAGAAIAAREYRTGGGTAGNVAARAINQVLGPIGGIETASNPRPAEGGADGETPQSFAARGPRSIRHRGRAVAACDYETLAREANASVARARAIPCKQPGGLNVPGWVTLVIIPHSSERRPWPSFGLREQVRRFVGERAAASLSAAEHIHVTGPNYVAVDIEAILVPVSMSAAGSVEQEARLALETFLHPLIAGPGGYGSEFGRSLFLSDVAAVLERVAGVDHVRELALTRAGDIQGDAVRVDKDAIVVAGQIRLKLES